MDTIATLRMVAESGAVDSAALKVLFQEAIRTNDETLLQFVVAHAERARKALEEEVRTLRSISFDARERLLNSDHLEFVGLMIEKFDRKIDAMKAIRKITGLGLRDAKNVADLVPSLVVRGGDTPERREKASEILANAGVTSRWIPSWPDVATQLNKTYAAPGLSFPEERPSVLFGER